MNFGADSGLDHWSFFSLGRYINEFIQIISFFAQYSFKLRCEAVIGIALCYSLEACCFHHYLCEIITSLPLTFTLPLPDVVVLSQLNKNFGGSMDLARKGADRRICIPLFTPPPLTLIGKKHIRSWSITMSLSTVRNLQPWAREKALGTRLRNLLISWKPIIKTKEKRNSVVQFQLSFAIFVAFPEFTQNAVRKITVYDGVFALEGHRYPIINSGDTIALRSAFTSGSYSTYWLYCGTGYCAWTTCQGSTIITSSGWTSCSKRIMFTITAKEKTDGEPIKSGDTVSLRSTSYSSSYRLYCSTSSSTYCRVGS